MLKKTKFAGARTKAQMNNKGGSGDGIFFDKASQTWGFRAVRNGKDTRKKGYSTRTEAKEARIAFVAEQQSGANQPTTPYTENTTITLNEIFNHYLENGSYDRRDGTITKQKSIWTNHIGPVWGNRTIVSISSGDLKNYLSELYYRGSVYNKFANGYAYSYVEGFLKVFYLIWGYAQSMRWISRDTYYFMCEDKNTKLKMPEKSKEDKDDEKIETYTQAEIDAMHARIENSNLHTAFLLGYYLGVRISECFGLMWSDIDWDKHTIHIQRQMLIQDSMRVLGPPKTEKSDREIDIPDKLYEHLLAKKKFEQECREYYGSSYRATEVVKVRIYKDQDDDLVGGDFINRKKNGEILTSNSMKSWATKFEEELGIDFKYHNLRHTHASFLAAMNCPLVKLMKRMGHSKIETTNQYYFGDNEIADEKMIQAINQLH